MDIGVVTNVNSSRGTIGVRVAGSRDEYLQDDVPILKSSAKLTILPEVGDRCLVSRISGDLICMGFLSPENDEEFEKNESRGSLPGDFQIGDEDTGAIGNLKGGMLTVLANNTGMMIIRDDRVANIIGDTIGFDTPVIHKTWGSEDGSAKIDESIFYALGEIINKEIDGGSGDADINIQRMKNIKIRINGDVTPVELGLLGRELETAEVEINTNAGPLTIKWDNVTQNFSIDIPGNAEINALGILKLMASSIGLNCPGANILQGLINGEYQCQFSGLPLSTTGQQLLNVQGGSGA